MPRRPDNARIEILTPLTTAILRPDSGVYQHTRDLQTGMTWGYARQHLPVTRTDWWWLLTRRYIRFVMPDGSELPFGRVQTAEPRVARTATAIQAVLDAPGFPAGYTYGVEIECILPRGVAHSQLRDALLAAGLSAYVERYGMPDPPAGRWKITTDGSLRCRGNRYARGAEVISPILQGSEGAKEIQRVCAVLKTLQITVNGSCGLHVHVGGAGRPLDWFKNILQIYATHETAIDSMLSPSRRGHDFYYARSVGFDQSCAQATDMDTLRSAYYTTLAAFHGPTYIRHQRRFRKVNLEAFLKHKTVEFRQHQGTVNPKKIIHWVKFVLALANRAMTAYEPDTDTSLETLLALIGVDNATRNYQLARRDQFARTSGVTLAQAA